jgi:hypothetical protein
MQELIASATADFHGSKYTKINSVSNSNSFRARGHRSITDALGVAT